MLLDLLGQEWPTPAIAFAVSALGAFLGLSFAFRARKAPKGFFRWQWLALATLSLGGVSVWSTHFMAMMSWSPTGVAVRYDEVTTFAVGAVALVSLGIALTLTVHRRSAPWLLLGGVVGGGGIAAAHHTGTAAVAVHGELQHDMAATAASFAVALVAVTAALWIAAHRHGHLATACASLLLAFAVSAMHYTDMAGVTVVTPEYARRGAPEGAAITDLLLPLMVTLFVFLLICSLFLLLGVEEKRPDYARRPGHAAPVAPDTAQEEQDHYVPRHSAAPLTTNTPPPRRSPADDVWTRRR
ncbi:MHYT domain-containing protein [Nocardiopsis algeriensis]|uniref:NO-binding membrane sensor protein with MHYT domain n=1 Tax=Nocardiopsis algeriensis TaxID=1478215 RepID=A0A841IHB3_9ACTN|nr:NO-binding membrane sensor protein with MHYT domain [Nocardiopsis algeriensis]